jgi:hypothetical protein
MSKPTARIERCTIQRRNGEFCDRPSGDLMPFPICAKHATELYYEMRDRLARVKSEPLELLVRSFDIIDDERKHAAKVAFPEVVYYVQIGDTIKIGRTTDLPARMRSYPPHRKLLATEPGNGGLERRRHAEFADYLFSGNEWFTPGPRLIEHIASLRERVA